MLNGIAILLHNAHALAKKAKTLEEFPVWLEDVPDDASPFIFLGFILSFHKKNDSFDS